MSKVVALFDKVGYLIGEHVHFAKKGEEFEVDTDQAKRHEELGAVAKAGSKAAKEADTPPPPGTSTSTDELMKLNRDDLNAQATSLGVAEPDKLPNKQAVADAIAAAQNG